MLCLRGVVKRYGDRVVLGGVNFGLDRGVVLLWVLMVVVSLLFSV